MKGLRALRAGARPGWVFNSPPGWPAPPPGWQPPKGWKPDPVWPPPPAGWEFWKPEAPAAPPGAGVAPQGGLAGLGLGSPAGSPEAGLASPAGPAGKGGGDSVSAAGRDVHLTFEGQEHVFPPGQLVRIGRASDNHIVVGHPAVSRKHAHLSWSQDGWMFENIGQAPTFRDGQSVTRVEVSRAVDLTLGSPRGPALHLEPAPPPPPAPTPTAVAEIAPSSPTVEVPPPTFAVRSPPPAAGDQAPPPAAEPEASPPAAGDQVPPASLASESTPAPAFTAEAPPPAAEPEAPPPAAGDQVPPASLASEATPAPAFTAEAPPPAAGGQAPPPAAEPEAPPPAVAEAPPPAAEPEAPPAAAPQDVAPGVGGQAPSARYAPADPPPGFGAAPPLYTPAGPPPAHAAQAPPAYAAQAQPPAYAAQAQPPAYAAQAQPRRGARAGAGPQPASGDELVQAFRILIPVRSWLNNPGWRQGLRLLVITYALLPLVFIALFASSGNLSTPGWAYGLYVAPLWAIGFWLLIRPGPVRALEVQVAVGIIVWTVVWLNVVTVNINDHLVRPNRVFSFPAALGVGYNEEITKALPVVLAGLILLKFRHTKLDVRMWMFLGTIAGLTFGVSEAALYASREIVIINKAQVASQAVAAVLSFAERVFVDGFQHAVWAGISAFFIGMAVNYPRRRIPLIILGVSIPAFLHATNDWSVGEFRSYWVWIIVQAVSLLLFLGYTMSAASIEQRVRQTPMFRGESLIMEAFREPKDT